MKIRLLYLRQILVLAFMIIGSYNIGYSQGTELQSENPSGLFFGLIVGPSQSQIVNTGTQSVSKLLSTKKNTFSGSLAIGYFFSKYFGLASGIGISPYKTQLTLDNYQNKLNTTDTENEVYERRITGSKIIEDQNISLLRIPVNLNIRIPFGKKVGLFIQPGVGLSVPLSKTYKSSGTFTYKGYYSKYNVLLEDLPNYNFPSDVPTKSEGELELKSMDLSFIATAGFDFLIAQKIQIGVGACYDRSLSTISGYSSPDQFQLSTDVNKINSLMGGSSKTTVQSMGLQIVFRYFLK
jgi:hypothetical protein